MEARRWDGDERGAGIASGDAFAPDLATLHGQLGATDWIAEDPHAHLLPHIVRACAAGRDLAVLETRFGDDGVYAVTLDWRPHDHSPPMRERIFAVIGSFAEASTHVVESSDREDDVVEYDVVTGMLPHQTPFRTHGHLVRLRIVRRSTADG